MMNRWPAICDLHARALSLLPSAIQGQLETGTGDEYGLKRNQAAFAETSLTPRPIGQGSRPVLDVELFGRSYKRPYGVSPLGTTDLIFPGADRALVSASVRSGFPVVRSMCASLAIEDEFAEGVPRWFQIYPVRDSSIMENIVLRARRSDIDVLVVTVDAPVLGRRERQRRNGFGMPRPNLGGPGFLMSCLAHPRWMLRMRRRKRFCPTLEPYAGGSGMRPVMEFVERQMPAAIDWPDLARLRELWEGPLVIKGVLAADDARRLVSLGVDGIWVSNHGGRQLDAAPASISALRDVQKVVRGEVPIILDSGVRSGLDVVRGYAAGADFVFLGRPFLYGLVAHDEIGAELVADILDEDVETTLSLMGRKSVSGAPDGKI